VIARGAARPSGRRSPARHQRRPAIAAGRRFFAADWPRSYEAVQAYRRARDIDMAIRSLSSAADPFILNP